MQIHFISQCFIVSMGAVFSMLILHDPIFILEALQHLVILFQKHSNIE